MTAPFGIDFYAAIDKFEVLEELGEAKYVVSPPKPHPSFDTFIVQATPTLGVVWVKALSPIISDDAYGNLTIQAMEKLHKQLSMRYGPGELTDFLMYDSIWSEPRDWASGLAANERSYFYSWENSKISNLPDDILTIYLGAIGVGGGDTRVSLEYLSPKGPEAEAELQVIHSDLL